VVCKPEVLLADLLDAAELNDLILAIDTVKRTRKGWGEITLEIKSGKIKKISFKQEILPGVE